MTIILILCASVLLFSTGCLVGYLLGREDGERGVYGAVERYYEGRSRST